MKTRNRRLIFALLALMLFAVYLPMTANAAMKINKKKATMYVGQNLKLKVKGAKKVKWTSSRKKVAKVSASGKVTALKQGKATITAKVGKKKYTCKITVKKKPEQQTVNPAPQPEDTTSSAENPTSQPTNPTSQPTSSTQQPSKPSSPTQTGGNSPAQTGGNSSGTGQVDPTKKTVSGQTELEQALRNTSLTQIILDTGGAGTFTIPAGDHKQVELVINAPNADVVNRGQFARIRILGIKKDTFTELGFGNSILFESTKAARIELGAEAKNTRIEVAPGKGSLLTLTLQDGAQNIEVTVNSDADLPKVEGIGSVKVTDSTTGVQAEILAENTNAGSGQAGGGGSSGVGSGTLTAELETYGAENAAAYLIPYKSDTNESNVKERLASATEPYPYHGIFNVQDACFTFANVPFGNYSMVVTADQYATLIRDFVWKSSMASETEAYVCDPIRLTPLMGRDGIFAISKVEGTGIIDFETTHAGYLNLIGMETQKTLPELTITFKNEGINQELILPLDNNGEANAEFNELKNDWDDLETVSAFLRVYNGVYEGIYCVTYDCSVTMEQLLKVSEVTGEHVYDYQYEAGFSTVGNGQTCDYLTVYTDCVDSYPSLSIRAREGVTVSGPVDETGTLEKYERNWSYSQKMILSYGEIGSADHVEKPVYICYKYQDANGNQDMSSLFTISEVTGEDVDGWELSGGYAGQLLVYYDQDNVIDPPADLKVTFDGGATYDLKVDITENPLAANPVTFERGIWSISGSVSYRNSMLPVDMTVNGGPSYTGYSLNPDEVVVYTDAWEDYPEVKVKQLQGVEQIVKWEPFDRDDYHYQGSLTLTNSARKRVYGIRLQYKDSQNREEGDLININSITGEHLDHYEVNNNKASRSVYLYYDEESGQKPSHLTVTLEDGTTEEVTLASDDEWLTVHSGIWSKRYYLAWFDSLNVTEAQLSCEEGHGINAMSTLGGRTYFDLYTGVWDHAPVVTVNNTIPKITSTVTWEPYTENGVEHTGFLTVSNGNGGTRKYGLDLWYSDGTNDIGDLEIASVTGEGVDEWSWSTSTGLYLYYDKETPGNTPPKDLTIGLRMGETDKGTANIISIKETEAGWEYGYLYATMTVKSGIWTRAFDVFYRDSFELNSGDVSVVGGKYATYLDKENRTISLYAPNTSVYPEVKVTTHGTTASISWAETLENGERSGTLTLTKGTRTEQYTLRLTYYEDTPEAAPESAQTTGEMPSEEVDENFDTLALFEENEQDTGWQENGSQENDLQEAVDLAEEDRSLEEELMFAMEEMEGIGEIEEIEEITEDVDAPVMDEGI